MTATTRTGRRGNRPLEVRMPATTRRLLQDVAAAQGSDASKVVSQFVAWWLNEPGAELPPRPMLDDQRPQAATSD